MTAATIDPASYYRIAGIFRVGKYLFFSNKLIFMHLFSFLHYSWPHPFRSLDSFSNEKKNKKLNPTKITHYTVYTEALSDSNACTLYQLVTITDMANYASTRVPK